MKQTSISKRILFGSAVIGLLLVGAFVPLLQAVRATASANDANRRAEDTQVLTTRILGLVVDVETGGRGFVITRQPRFLEPWHRGRRQLPGELRRLVQATAGDPHQRSIAGSLRRDATRYLEDFSEPFIAAARRGDRRVVEIVTSGEGKRRVDALRAQTRALLAGIAGELEARRSDQEALEARAIRICVAALLGSVAVVLVMALYLRRSIATPVERLRSAAHRLGEGELDARVPEDGAADFVDLARSFNTMAASLQSSRGKLEVSNREAAEARAEAERANQAKSEFVSRMSHELRTPLNSVLGFGQLLALDGLNDEQRQQVNQILKSGGHLLELINEVLDISRVEAGRMSISPEPVQLSPALEEVTAMMEPAAAERRISIERATAVECGPFLLADQQRLRQVLLNLVSNAVKYNHAGGSVHIGCEPGGPGRTRIAVRDTGPGIPAEQLGQLFEPFDRLGAEGTGVEGTGLGLALSKRLVELMDGSIWAESEPGAGTTFFVELGNAETPPGREEDATPAGDHPVGAAPSGGWRVLCIEDNASNLAVVRSALEHLGDARLIPAMHGRLGLELAEQHRPDVVLLDLHLPDMEGAQALAELKSNPRTRQIPVIVLSADATERQVRRLERAGAYAYLTKPIDLRSFLETVREAAAHAETAHG